MFSSQTALFLQAIPGDLSEKLRHGVHIFPCMYVLSLANTLTACEVFNYSLSFLLTGKYSTILHCSLFPL